MQMLKMPQYNQHPVKDIAKYTDLLNSNSILNHLIIFYL